MVKRTRIAFVNGLLLVGLVGLLILYFALVSNLPSQIYTVTQREYLSYNYSRSISQVAPTWNVVESGSQLGPAFLPGQESHIQATLAARYEEQEGINVTVYDLDFRGEYHLAHPGPMATTVELLFPFPDNLQTLHEVRFLVDGEEPPEANYTTRGISWQTVLEAGEEHQIVVSYQADGANSFSYGLHHGQRGDVDITVTVVDLLGSEAPKTSLPPTAREVDGNRETFTWDYEGLIADRDIQLTLPIRLSFAQRVAQLQEDFRLLAGLAPFLVSLFLASLAGVLHLSDVHLRLESYLLTGFGLALFYPMLTFLSGAVNVILASALALSLVSGLLLVFLSLTAGRRGIWLRVGLLLVVFLGFFSLGMLTPWRGLLLSSGGLLLAGTFMLLHARRPTPEPDPILLPEETAPEPEPDPPPSEAALEATELHCPYCARALTDDFNFCPGCGHDTGHLHRCADCGHTQLVPAELESVYCIHCGQLLN